MTSNTSASAVASTRRRRQWCAHRYRRRDPGCCEPLPDERRGALVARIGSDVFIVGNGGEYSSPAGTIFLRVNDCDDGLLDNSGELSVEFIP